MNHVCNIYIYFLKHSIQKTIITKITFFDPLMSSQIKSSSKFMKSFVFVISTFMIEAIREISDALCCLHPDNEFFKNADYSRVRYLVGGISRMISTSNFIIK